MSRTSSTCRAFSPVAVSYDNAYKHAFGSHIRSSGRKLDEAIDRRHAPDAEEWNAMIYLGAKRRSDKDRNNISGKLYRPVHQARRHRERDPIRSENRVRSH